jgi:hypothetical protein
MGRGPISIILCFLVVTSSASAQAPIEYCYNVLMHQLPELEQIADAASDAATTEPDVDVACDLWRQALEAQQQVVTYLNQCARAAAIPAAQRARLFERMWRRCSGLTFFSPPRSR